MTKTVLITGASGKLGSAIAQHLATLGWSMVLTSRDPERCEPLVRVLRVQGVEVCAVALDLKSQDSTDTLAARIAELNVRVTHVVSNARSLETLAVGEDGVSQVQPFMDELSIDVVSPYRMLMAFSRDQSHDLRAVVTIGSQYGQVGPTSSRYDGDLNCSPIQYGVAKAALHHMTRELAVRLAPRVRVNCVAFGGFVGRADAAFQERYARLAPLGRMLTDDDAGGPVAFLLDDAAGAAVTGHVLMADCGWTVW